MKLAEFMHEKGLSDEALGAALDVSRVTISRLRREKAEPSFELLKRLATYSDGAVTPNDFLRAEMELASSQQAVA
jgi:transcriptional regulator with XRE-family HTH domain